VTRARVLHCDRDGNRVILHTQTDDTGNVVKCWVTYERYPGLEFEYVAKREAAERILRGRTLECCYIEAVSRDALLAVQDRIAVESDQRRERTPPPPDERGEVLPLEIPLLCRGCLLGGIDMARVRFLHKVYASLLPAPCVASHVFGGCRFEGAVFEDQVVFEGTNFWDHAEFHEAAFNGETSLWNARFHGGALFRAARFCGRLELGHASFERRADFSDCTFKSRVDLTGTVFTGEADFSNARFSDICRLAHVAFRKDADFSSANFEYVANFSRCNFGGRADLTNATLLMGNFLQATFAGNAVFHGVTAGVLCLAGCRFEKTCTLTKLAGGHVDLELAVFAENLILSTEHDPRQARQKAHAIEQRVNDRMKQLVSTSDASTGVKKDDPRRAFCLLPLGELATSWCESERAVCSVELRNSLVHGDLLCFFRDLRPARPSKTRGARRRPVLEPHRQAVGLAPARLRLEEDEPTKVIQYEAPWEEARRQYAWLKEQYRKQGAYTDEDQAHEWASECARRGTRGSLWHLLWLLPPVAAWLWVDEDAFFTLWPLLFAATIGCGLLAAPRIGKLVVFKIVFGYGVKPWNVVATILAVVLAFSLVFAKAHQVGLIKPHPSVDTVPAFASPLANGLYFSVITFATVGYGDVRGTGWAASFAMIEGLLGVVLNAALVIVIFRKMVR